MSADGNQVMDLGRSYHGTHGLVVWRCSGMPSVIWFDGEPGAQIPQPPIRIRNFGKVSQDQCWSALDMKQQRAEPTEDDLCFVPFWN